MIKTVSIEKLDEFLDDPVYLSKVEDLTESLYKDPLVDFVPGVSKKWEYSEETEKLLDDLCEYTLPTIAEVYYDGDIKIIDTKFLRHLALEESKIEGAFEWHSDNHPPEILNIIVYLSDVGENDGGMQYASVDGRILIREYTDPPGNHSLEGNIAGASTIDGFKIESMTGKKGTFFIFDNCIYHRASHTVENDRDALLLQVAPA
mgnify:FL=1